MFAAIEEMFDKYEDLIKDGARAGGKQLGEKLAELLKDRVKSTENEVDDVGAEFLEGVAEGLLSVEIVKDATAPAEDAAEAIKPE